MTLLHAYLHARQSPKNVQACLRGCFVCCFVSCHSQTAVRPKARPKGVLACLTERQKYIFSLFMREFSCSAYLSSFSLCDLAGKESRKSDVVANMMEVEVYWEGGEVEKKKKERESGRMWRREDVREGEQRWGVSWGWREGGMKSGEKMERVDFVFPSGCCQVYK